MSFVAWTQVNCMSKTLEDDLKIIKSEQQWHGISAKFSNLPKERKTVAMCFGDIIISVTMSALKCSQIGSLLLLQGSGKVPGYFSLLS